MLLQDPSLLDDMLEDGTSRDNSHLPICLKNTLDVGQGSVIFFDVEIWSKILSGNVFCNECAMLKLA